MARRAAVSETETGVRRARKPLAEMEEGPQTLEPRADRGSATLRFLSGWVTAQTGELRRGGRLVVEYDPDRLPNLRATYNGMATWAIYAHVRFHPRGQYSTGGLLQYLHADPPQPLEQPRSLARELDVPEDATQVELWFSNSDRSGRTEWDSRFGQNYWVDVGPPPPSPPVSYRTVSVTSLDMVNVFSDAPTKVNAFPQGELGRNGTDLETRLFVQAWVRNLLPTKYVWVDLHVVDGSGYLVHSETLPWPGWRRPVEAGTSSRWTGSSTRARSKPRVRSRSAPTPAPSSTVSPTRSTGGSTPTGCSTSTPSPKTRWRAEAPSSHPNPTEDSRHRGNHDQR